jgi:hypothetical protein
MRRLLWELIGTRPRRRFSLIVPPRKSDALKIKKGERYVLPF